MLKFCYLQDDGNKRMKDGVESCMYEEFGNKGYLLKLYLKNTLIKNTKLCEQRAPECVLFQIELNIQN